MKYRSLEALRGIAALLVALFHSNFIAGSPNNLIQQGTIFVDFFFILSGFVLFFAYFEKIQKGLNFKFFITLRFGRVYPLHLFMLIVWLPVILAKAYAYYQLGVGHNDPFTHNNIATFISNVLLINSLGLHSDISWNYPAWSISVEFFTYIIFFLYASKLPYANKPISLLLMSILSYGILYQVSDDTLLRTFDYGILRCCGGFFLGAFLFTLTQKKQYQLSNLSASIFELLSIILVIYLVNQSGLSKPNQLMAFAAFSVMIYLFTIQEKGIVSYFLGTRLMQLLGTLSYSIYMVHALVFAILGALWQVVLKMPVAYIEKEGETVKQLDTAYADLINIIALIIVVMLSYLTYRFIEEPWRDKFRRLATKQNSKSLEQ